MSVDQAKAFVEKMKSDRVFAKEVMDCKTQEARMEFAVASGFLFTAEEMKGVNANLSDEELELVVGGKMITPCPKGSSDPSSDNNVTGIRGPAN